jgi:L-2-hydroxyglutarate oxidase LhgO
MDETLIDCVVVGAGVVGLAVARALAQAGREVVVLEAASAIGTGTSSRNSEVIHAGLYYTAGSLKASLCVAGKRQLYAYCASHHIAHRRCGKLIVATSEAQIPALQALQDKAVANGLVGDEALQWLSREQAQALEPALSCAGALLSPSTGIVDSHALMLALQGDAEAAGTMLAFNSPVLGGEVTPGGVVLEVGGSEPGRWRVRTLVNCAGLQAQQLAARLAGFPTAHVPPTFYAKGNYFTTGGRAPFSRLIYPVPEAAGLGVHLTLDLQGQARFGPDVEWVDDLHYPVDEQRAQAFYAEVRKYWPGLVDGALHADYAGIRPKLGGPGEPAQDFLVSGPAEHGVAGVHHLFGIESPGLTACLALADHVAGQVAAG